MRLYKLSNDFTPRHEGLLFGIETEFDEPQDVEVEVVDVTTNEVVATQLLHEVTTAEVNIAPYVAPLGDYAPSRPLYTTFVEAPTRLFAVRVGDVDSEPIVVSVNREAVTLPTLLTSMPQTRRIAYGEWDELLVLTERGAIIEANIDADTGESISVEYTSENGAATLCILTKDFGKKVRTFDVEIICDGALLTTLHYTVVPKRKGALRLAWLSDGGSIERYTFPISVKQQRTVERVCIETLEGSRVVSTVAVSTLSMKSHYEPRKVVEALAQITSSTRVWIESEESSSEVLPLTAVVDVNIFGEPESLSVGVQLWRREERAL